MHSDPKFFDSGNDGAWVRRLVIFWIVCIALTAAADFFLYFLEWLPGEIVRRSFDIGIEESLGTWISTNLTLFTGLVAAAILAGEWRNGLLKDRIGWCIVSLFFIFISFDDAAKFHERAGTTLRLKYEKLADTALESWFPSWGWQLFVAPFFALAGCFILYFLWTAILPRLRKWVLVGFGLFAIAVLADFVEGMELASGRNAEHLIRLAEETIEMLGATAFLYVFLVEFDRRFRLLLRRKEQNP